VGLMATSCYYDESPPEPEIPIPDVVSYSNDIQPLWDKDCINCHRPNATPPDLTAPNSYSALTTNNKYVVPGNAAGSKLHKSLTGDGVMIMPSEAGKWSASQVELVDKWINAGAPNN